MRLRAVALGSLIGGALVACGSRTTLRGSPVLDDEATGGVPGAGGTPGAGGIPSAGGAPGGGGASTGGTGAAPFPFALGFGDEASQGATAVQATDSGPWVAGYFYGDLGLDGAKLRSVDEADSFLVKLDLEGNVTRSLALSGPGRQDVYALALAKDGGLLVGGAFRDNIALGSELLVGAGKLDGYVARFDSRGNTKWAFGFGNDNYQYVNDVAIAPDGRAVALSTYGTGNLPLTVGSWPVTSAGSGDFMLFRLDERGVAGEPHTYGGPGNDRAAAFTIDPNGTAWIVGTYHYPVDFGCGELPQPNGTDVFLLGVDESGDCVASLVLTHTGDNHAADIASDSQGNLVVSGAFEGTLAVQGQERRTGKGFFLLGLTPQLEPRFSYVLPDDAWMSWYPPTLFAPRLDVDASDHVLVAGFYAGTPSEVFSAPSAGVDAFVLELDESGNPLWVKSFGEAAGQAAYAVSAGPGIVYVAGAFEGALSGTVPELVSRGYDDGFVLGLAR